MAGRAIRRHHERRIKERVKTYYGGYGSADPKAIGRIAHAKVNCSGPCCGNPRKHWNLTTIQERRAEHAEI